LTLRARRTLDLTHEWGYAPTLQALAEDLLEGSVDIPTLLDSIRNSTDIVVEDGFVFKRGHRELLAKSQRRVESHRNLNGMAWTIARRYAGELIRTCPLVDCVALSGSVASGGYESRDDIDLNLFVVDGAKYFVYAIALILGFRSTLRHRKVLGLRKLICINVLWTRGESHPFSRQDEGLAFELLHSRPLLGERHFQEVITANPWIDAFFPQLRRISGATTSIPAVNLLGRLVSWVGRHPRWLRAVDRSARLVTRAIYSGGHWLHRHDATRMGRLEFLQRVKYPYEVFQD
jgi:hypothetical protein